MIPGSNSSCDWHIQALWLDEIEGNSFEKVVSVRKESTFRFKRNIRRVERRICAASGYPQETKNGIYVRVQRMGSYTLIDHEVLIWLWIGNLKVPGLVSR